MHPHARTHARTHVHVRRMHACACTTAGAQVIIVRMWGYDCTSPGMWFAREGSLATILHAPASWQRDTNPGNQGKREIFWRRWRLESMSVSVSVSLSPSAMGQIKYSITRSTAFPPRLLFRPTCARAAHTTNMRKRRWRTK
jgi:hypothetical protein